MHFQGQNAQLHPQTATPQSGRYYVYAALVCGLTAALALPLRDRFDAANIVVIFLLAVVIVALRYGRGPSVLAAFLSVGLFDFFFVPPHFSFAVSDAQYLVTFAVMLIVGLITGQLTAGLRQAAVAATARENNTRALYEVARELAGALTLQQVLETSQRFALDTLESRIAVLLPDAEGRIRAPAGADWVDGVTAELAYQSPAYLENDAGATVLYLPLAAPSRVRGVLLERLGPVVWESSVSKAAYALEELEETAKLWHLAGGNVTPLEESALQELREVFSARW